MSTPNFSTADLDARVDRFGRGVAARLSERTAAMPHDVTERLRFAREQALVRAAQARAAASAAAAAVATTGPSLVQVGSTLALGGVSGGAGGNDRGGRGGLWAKLVSALPLLALAGGLLLMQQSQIQEQLVAAAEVDTALLSDNLPPAAFSDPGFAEYLRDGEGQQ